MHPSYRASATRHRVPLSLLLLFIVAACSDRPTAPPHPAHTTLRDQQETPSGPTVVARWNDAALEAVRRVKPGPPMVARAMAVTQTSVYDAWAAYDARALGTRLGGTLRRPAHERTTANKREAVSFAAYRTLVDLFPTQRAMFEALMRDLGYDPANATADITTPAGIGNTAAAAVIAYRHHDGANQLGDLHPGPYSDYTGYVPVNSWDHLVDPNRWQPLRLPDGRGGFIVQPFVGSFWQRVMPFALTSAAQFRPVELPNRYPSAGYYAEVDEILAYSAALTDEQKVIAEYWADGPSSELPPGQWCLFASFVSARDHHGIDEDVKLLFALTNATLDAGIVAWDAKREYDSVRPVSAVHFARAGQRVRAWAGPYLGTQMIRAEDWQPYQEATVVTPPFPEFISGHSLFSASAAEVLRRFTGSDLFGASMVQPAGTSRVEPGLVPARDVTLTWATFSEAADQAGMSRRYGGIHFVQADLQARALGRLVGAQAWKKAQMYFRDDVDESAEHRGS
ncbi:MAG: hypothetical protein NVS1B4_25090 [Gemmatimonadaceae bacterium]